MESAIDELSPKTHTHTQKPGVFFGLNMFTSTTLLAKVGQVTESIQNLKEAINLDTVTS